MGWGSARAKSQGSGGEMHTNDALIAQRQNQSKNEKHKKMLYKYYGGQYEYENENEYEYIYAYVHVIYVTDIYGHKYTCVYIRKSIWQYFNVGCTDIDIDSDSEHQQ